MIRNATHQFDYILVGGGLQSGLLALALLHHQPGVKILLVERGVSLGGNHTWSFHDADVPQTAAKWVATISATRWGAYRVRFPGLDRVVSSRYASISSEQFSEAVRLEMEAGYGNRILLRCNAVEVAPHHVVLDDGARYSARLVVDCRGPRHYPGGEGGVQKFVGFEVEFENAWPDNLPVLMDGCVNQDDGFRFMYVLPFTRRRVLLEDTCFSNHADLDRDASLAAVSEYIARTTDSNWRIVREEQGRLPMPFAQGGFPEASLPLRGGYAGGWFHAATGYSFPLAVRFADAVARVDAAEAEEAVADLARRNQFQSGFGRFLNHLMFRLTPAESRWEIFRRLYRSLPESVLSRFYAHEFTRWDACRLLVGKPPSGLLRSLLSLR